MKVDKRYTTMNSKAPSNDLDKESLYCDDESGSLITINVTEPYDEREQLNQLLNYDDQEYANN